MTDTDQVAALADVGSLGVFHLKRIWSRTILARTGTPLEPCDEEDADRLVIDALGLGLQQTFHYLYTNAPSFADFEDWVVSTAGRPTDECVSRLNATLIGTKPPEAIRKWLMEIEAADPALTTADLDFWNENGYVVLSDAVSPDARLAAEQAIWNHVGADPDSTESWYQKGAQGIMVELIQHPAFERTRRSPRIHKAFAQLWGTADLWVSSDRCGFHVPQREGHPFPGPDLHWDVDFSRSAAFATQGILYLTDTPPEQGALTVVPGFHRRLSEWLQTLPSGSDPQKEDLHALGSMPVGGKAGDLIVWNHALPHGSRPNLGSRPRIVQYINMYPGSNSQTRGSYQHAPCRESDVG